MLDLPSGILVHGCNAQGVMESGIALQVKQRHPKAYREYERVVSTSPPSHRKMLLLGATPWVEVSKDLIIVNAITQENYGSDGKKYVSEKAIETAFNFVQALAASRRLPVHFPLIGCGLGGGEWSKIGPIIERALGPAINGHLWLLPGDPMLEVNPFLKT